MGLGIELANIVASAGGPERVNDGPETHPSLRLATIVKRLGSRLYGKVTDGPDILTKAGIETVRATCPHFADWLHWLENLAAA